jgi:uncharacterized membrane protein YheB (UPF0754 family)
MEKYMLGLKILVSTAMGGAVGWVTNSIAINMLFKKYWKWGGIVEDNYEEFIRDMSDLVETDLINVKTLQNEFASDAFRNVLRKWVSDIIRKELPENSGSLRFRDVRGVQKTVRDVITLFNKVQPQLIAGVYSAISADTIDALISHEQYKFSVNNGVKIIFENKADYEYKIQNALAGFLRDRPLGDIISNRAIRQISDNLGEIIQKVDLSKFDSDIDHAWNDLLDTIKIDACIKTLQKDLGRMRLCDFVKNPEKLSRGLVKKAADFVRTDDGQKLLLGVVKNFLSDVQKINLKIADIVSPDIKDGIIHFCQTKMPGIINSIARFLEGTRDEIEYIVNTTVDNQLDTTLGGKIIKFFKDIFIENLAGKANVVGKIIQKLHEYGDNAGDELSCRLINLLETKTIGEIVTAAVKSGAVSAEALVELVNRNIKEIENKELKFIDTIMDKQVDSIFGTFDFSNMIKTKALPELLKKIKEGYLYDERCKRDIRRVLGDKITELAGKNTADIVDIDSIKIPLNEEKIRGAILAAWKTIGSTHIVDILGEHPSLPSIKQDALEVLWRKNEEREFNWVYNALQRDEIYTKVADGIITVINQNLDAILCGNVSKLVNNELGKLRPSEINTMVQNFMGKEMKVINILGAVLGLLVGGISAAGALFLNLPATFEAWMLAAYGAIFAIVGIGTNWLAIRCLFRPYTTRFKGAKWPPFIGLVAAQKPIFAKNMGAFVKERMLGEDALLKFFDKKKDRLKDNVKTRVCADNYAIIDNVFFQKEETLATIYNAVFNAIRSALAANRSKIALAISGVLQESIESGKFYDVIPAIRDTIVNKLKQADIAGLAKNYIEKEIDGKTLNDYKKIIDKFTDLQLKKALDAILDNLSHEITPDKIKKLINEQNDNFVKFISKNSIASAVGKDGVDSFTGKISEHIQPLLRKGINPIVNALENQELNPRRRLNEVFDGALPNLLKKNIGFIIDMLSKEASKMKPALIEQINDNLPWYAFPAKGHIRPIVTTLIDKEVPAFLRRKQGELLDIAERLLEHRLSDLGFTSRSLDKATIEKTVAAILTSPHVGKGIAHFCEIIIKELCSMPVQTLLELVNIRSLHDITRIAEPLIDDAVHHITDNITNDSTSDVLAKLLKNVIMKILPSVSFDNILHEIELEKELRNLTVKLTNDTRIIDDCTDIIENILFDIEKTASRGKNSFYSAMLLERDIENYFAGLESIGGWERLREAVRPACRELLLHANGVLDIETKNHILDLLLDALIRSAEYNFPYMLKTIDVQSIIEREINNMHPKDIETLFNKFAGVYFRKIIFYGWIGVFGGILSYVIDVIITKFIK